MKKNLLLMATFLTMAICIGANASPRRSVVNNDRLESCGDMTAIVRTTQNSSTRAANECVFGYSFSPYTAYSFKEVERGVYVYFATEISTSDLELFKGAKITGMNVYGGINTQYNRNPNTMVTVFLTNDLKSEPYYSQEAKITNEALGKNRVTFTTPQDFDPNKPLYAGFYFKATNLTEYCMVVDAISTDKARALVAFGTGDKVPQSWQNHAAETGSICLQIALEGDNLPQNTATLPFCTSELCYRTGEVPEFDVAIRNIGYAPLSSVKLRFEATGEDPYEKSIPIDTDEMLVSGDNGLFEIIGNAFKNTGQKTVKISIVEANGAPNTYNSEASAETVCTDTSYPRKMVLEEGTGTWCPWCPASLVMLDYCKEKYPDIVYRIAAHASDKMQVNSYIPWLNVFASGVPAAMMNRVEDLAPTRPGVLRDIDDIIEESKTRPMYVNTEIKTVTLNDDLSKCEAYTYTTFSVDLEREYCVSVAIVEDGLGPYNQANNYAGGSNGVMGGWENLGSSVSYVYDDVARYLSSYPAVYNLPAKLKKDQVYFLKIPVDLRNVRGEKYRAIVMVSDNKTGEILNAGQTEFVKSGVSDIISDKSEPTIRVNGRHISIEGADEAAVYTISGAKIASGSADVPAGIYVVKADNKVCKVIVK